MIRIYKMNEFIPEEKKTLKQSEKDFAVFFLLILKGTEEGFTFTK